jgi:lipopolysaccharide transport system ATP-binding protein
MSMSQPIIVAGNLGKRYRIGRRASAGAAWRSALGARLRRCLSVATDAETDRAGGDFIWALRDASFDVQPGEVVGIIGRNGAGKSTLLKILARIVYPTTGRAVIHGRVGSLLEVGTGFHPELTGRENIYLNGAILGMRRAEIRRVFDEIVAFAEIEKFLDTPVKRYSSGMYVRLAFAVAAHLNPELLLVDEVLAVGDLNFQKKCLDKMGAVTRSGRTILFVSHNLAAMQGLCRRGLVIEQGRIAFDGEINAAIQRYLASVAGAADGAALRQRTDRAGSGELRFTAVRFRGPHGQTDGFLTGQPFRAELEYEAEHALRNVTVFVPVYTQLGQTVFAAWTRLVEQDFERLPPQGRIVVEVPRLPLREGRYAIDIFCKVNTVLADHVREAASFTAVDGDFFGTGHRAPEGWGLVMVEHRFRFEPLEAPQTETSAAPLAAGTLR